MKKIRVNKVFIISIITLSVLSLIIYSSVPGSKLGILSSPISFITDPLHTGLTNASQNIRGFISSILESEKIRKENEELKEENLILKTKIKDLEEGGRRWEELKSALNIRDIYSDYEIIGAAVLTRGTGEWFDVFRVNAGIRDGIVIDENISYAVVDAQMNLVGRVVSSDYTSSKILPIINEGSIVSAKVNRPGGVTLRIRGDMILKQDGYCIGDNISDYFEIRQGDEIVTSGTGGLYPPGIPLGVVESVGQGLSRTDNTVIIKVNSEYKTLTDVFIMKGSNSIE